MAVSTHVCCGLIAGRQPPAQPPPTYQSSGRLFDASSVSQDSLLGVSGHRVERRSHTLLSGDHLPQLDRKTVDSETRPCGQMRLGPHAVGDRVERDAKMACRANADHGLGLDARIVEIALTDRARAATEQTGPRGDICTRGPLHQNPGRIRPLAVLRQPQITPALTTKTWRLVKAALARGPEGQFRRTWGRFDEPDYPRLGRVVTHRKPLASVDRDAGAAF